MTHKTMTIFCIAGLIAVTTQASANEGENLLFNPGFEIANPAIPSLPQGWGGINVGAPEWVDINDPGAHVRSGSKAIRLDPASGPGDAFQGWTTNIFLPDGSDLYDPDYEYLGGDVHIKGWYLVPEGQELANDITGIKLEFRREPPNFSIYVAFEFTVPQSATNGEWVEFHATVTDDMMLAVGDFPPYATSVSVLPFRFNPGPPAPTGTIFWDDLYLFQGDLPGGCNEADLAEPFGILDLADISAFITAFIAQDPAADIAPPFGVWDLQDITAFVTAFTAGCP